MKEKNSDIEALRALAVLFTIGQHSVVLLFWDPPLHQQFFKTFSLWTGVDLFFAISGFVIATNLINKLECASNADKFWMNVVGFWIKRIHRIWPSSFIWASIVVVLSALLRKTHEFASIQQNLADLVAVVTQTSNIHYYECLNGRLDQCGGFWVWWSLSLEEQFYIALPIMFFIFRRKLPYILGALTLMQIFLSRPVWSFMWAIRTDAICLGVMLAYFSRTEIYKNIDPKFMRSPIVAAAMMSIMTLLLMTLPGGDKISIISFSTGLVAVVSVAMVFVASFNKNYICRQWIGAPLVMWIGSRSYAIYVTHAIMMVMTRVVWRYVEPSRFHFDSRFTLRFVLTWLALTVILSEINYRLIEMPLRKKGRDTARRIENAGMQIVSSNLVRTENRHAVAVAE